jgi:hypothetical protein
LASLFKSKYNYNSLQYPSDLKSNEKNHYVVFQIYNVKSYGISDVKKLIASTLESAPVQAVAGYVQKTYDTATSQGLGAAINQVGIDGNFNRDVAAFGNRISSTIMGNETTVTQFLENRKDLASTVTLYMPDTLEFTQSAEYPETDVMTAAASLGGAAELIGKGASAINSIANNTAAKLALNKLGYAFNPQQMLLFQGIPFREFPMSFTFTAESAQEAAQIQRIIREFRMYAAPTVVTETAGFFFKPPGIFKLSFWSNGQINSNINQVTDCVLKSVDVNYAPNGWSAHKDGKPVQITMNLQFQETSLVDRTKISQGF